MVDDNRVDVQFGAQTSELDDAFDKLKEGAKSLGEQVTEGFNPATAAAVAMGEAIAKLGEEIGKHIAEAVSEAIHAYAEWGDEIEHLQHRIGESAENLSVLRVALDSVGISQGQYEAIARRLPMVLEKNADAFKAAGIAYTDASNNLLPVSEVIQNISTHLETFTAGSARNAEGVALMGRSYSMMADMIELTKDRQAEATDVAKKFGLVMSQDDLDATNEFNRQTSLLHESIHGFYVTIGQALTPALTDLAIAMRSILVPVFEVFSVVVKVVGVAFDGIVMSVTIVVAAIDSLAASFELLIKLTAAAARALTGDFKGGMDMAKQAVEDYKKTIGDLGDMVTKTAGDLNAHMGRILSPSGAPEPEKLTQANLPDKNAADRSALAKAQAEAELAVQKEYLKESQAIYKDSYEKSKISTKEFYDAKLAIELAGVDASLAAKNKELGESKSKVAKDQAEALKFQTEQTRLAGQINVLEAQRNDLVRSNAVEYTNAENARTAAMEKTLAQEQLNAANAKIAQEQSNNKQMLALRQIDAATAFNLQKDEENKSFAATQEFQRKKLEADLLTSKNREQTIADARVREEETEAKHQQKLTDIDNAAELERQKYSIQAANALQSSFTTAFEDMMKGTKSMSDVFKSFADNVISQILRIQAQKMAAQLVGSGAGASGGTGGGGLIAAVLGGSFAVGTNYVPNDMLAMVHKGERIVPASQNNPNAMGNGGQPVTVNNNFILSTPPDNRTQTQMATLVGLSIQRAMARNA